ncbi:hypothetical protein, partial [Pseudomonas paraeruginosa]|uniref:hypothetical protein n=1 Tax=Pseudomonas paraeruginosa TaxID=2994495 RepID=UPI001C3FBD3B
AERRSLDRMSARPHPKTPNRMRFSMRTTGQDGRAGGGLDDEASTGCRLGLTQDAKPHAF